MPVEPLLDPFCKLAQGKTRIKGDDEDPNLAALSQYAHRVHNYRTYRLENGKVGFGGPEINKRYGKRGALEVFGQEGDDFATTAGKAQLYLKALSEQKQDLLGKSIEQLGNAAHGKIPPIEAPMQWSEIGPDGKQMQAQLNALPDLGDASRELVGQRGFHSLRYKLFGGNRWLVGVHTALKALGEGGTQMALLWDRRNNFLDMILGRSMIKLQDSLKVLADAEAANPLPGRRKGELILEGFQRYVENKRELVYTTTDSLGNKIQVDNRPYAPALEQARVMVKKYNDQLYNEARAAGIPVKEYIEDYFPHRFDMTKIRDRRITEQTIKDTMAVFGLTRRDDAIRLLEKQVSQGYADSKTLDMGAVARQLVANKPQIYGGPQGYQDALNFVRKYFMASRERLAGNLEKERLGVKGYITDMRRAYAATWTRNSYRITDASILGRSDQRVHQLLAQIERERPGDPAAREFAERVYHLEIGQADSSLDRSPILKELYMWEGAKLSLAALANSTQTLNTIIHVGLKPTMQAAARLAAKSWRERRLTGTVQRLAEETGTLPVSLLETGEGPLQLVGEIGDKVRRGGLSMLVEPDELFGPVGEKIRKSARWISSQFGLRIFRGIESWNRAIAEVGGEIYFDQMVNVLKKRGASGLQHRHLGQRLLEMDMDGAKVLEMVRNGDTEALGHLRAKAGLRVAQATQFSSGIQSMPLWRNNSELGKFIYQYKTFGLGQSRFMLKALDPHNFKTNPELALRAWTVALTTFPAVGIGVTALRGKLMGDTTLTGDAVQAALDDPSFFNLAVAGTVGALGIGSFGIMADGLSTALTGNEFSIKNFIVPPVGSSAVNLLTAGATAFKAMVTGDSSDLLQTTRSLSRELGGAGSIIQNQLVEPFVFPGLGRL